MKTSLHTSSLRWALTLLCLLAWMAPASAQILTDLLGGGQPGTSDVPLYTYTPQQQASPAPGQTAPIPLPTDVAPSSLPTTGIVPPVVGSIPAAARPQSVPGQGALPLPPNPALSSTPTVFGSQIFTGRFAAEPMVGFNPDYVIAPGDRLMIRMWGAFNYDAPQVVDGQGNIFIPNVGPISVQGVRNADLHTVIEGKVKRTFRSNVGIYATLDSAQPVKVYVTGFVRAPGLYGGLSSDSVLHYLDMAGGIDPDRGSYLDVDILRGGKQRAHIDLYGFLLEGRIQPVQFQDGDTVVVHQRLHAVTVGGEVLNPYIFELHDATVSGADLLALARPKPTATHMSIVRSIGTERRSEYHPLADAGKVSIHDGDIVTVTADKYPATILVRVQGAQTGEGMLVLPQGATLQDALARVHPSAQADMSAVQLFRASVADRQKQLLDTSLRSLETYALTARSATTEEASLRTKEASQILQFIDRARQIQPKGQVILAQGTDAGATLLEDGDVLAIPEKTNLVLVAGEVTFPNALIYDRSAGTDEYIERAGGYTQGADKSKVMVIHRDGSVADAHSEQPRAGDEIMVLPKIETKHLEITRGITQIVYQIAVAAKVLLGL